VAFCIFMVSKVHDAVGKKEVSRMPFSTFSFF
jgi:hypothetical protein